MDWLPKGYMNLESLLRLLWFCVLDSREAKFSEVTGTAGQAQ
jgi:hypothetical protein